MVRIRPNFNQYLPRIGRSWPKTATFDETGPESTKPGPNVVKVGPGSTKFGPRSTKVDAPNRPLARIDQTWPEVGQIWPDFGQIWPGFGQLRPESCQVRRTIAQKNTNLDRNRVALPGPCCRYQGGPRDLGPRASTPSRRKLHRVSSESNGCLGAKSPAFVVPWRESVSSAKRLAREFICVWSQPPSVKRTMSQDTIEARKLRSQEVELKRRGGRKKCVHATAPRRRSTSRSTLRGLLHNFRGSARDK